MSVDALADKTKAVLELLYNAKHKPKLGGKITGTNRDALQDLINQQRRQRRIGGAMHNSNLSTYLLHPARAPHDFLNELTHSLGLTDLGFDETIWARERSAILAAVTAALEGGVLATVLRNDRVASLFEMFPRVPMGFDFDRASPEPTLFDLIPEFTVVAGESIATRANMQFPGYLRVIAGVEQEFIGMNEFLGIPSDRIETGSHDYAEAPTSAHVARTVVYAFASPEPVFGDWPVSHFRPHRLAHGRMLELLNAFFALEGFVRQACVQAFVTTIPVRATL